MPYRSGMAHIAIFDSGIGGRTVLDNVRARAPWADLIYVADHAFGPYGERTLEEVKARTELLARFLATAGVTEIVIACNSASAAALHHLRKVLPELTFVGMEPAVKPASELTDNGVVAVLATGATFQGELFRSLVGLHATDVVLVEQACPGLAAAVELEDGFHLAEARVKEIVGGDTISARFMRGEWFDFRPLCKLWIATNHRPKIKGTDYGMWRRVRLIPFEVTIENPDRELISKLARIRGDGLEALERDAVVARLFLEGANLDPVGACFVGFELEHLRPARRSVDLP